jgi:hypothetical protein
MAEGESKVLASHSGGGSLGPFAVAQRAYRSHRKSFSQLVGCFWIVSFDPIANAFQVVGCQNGPADYHQG